MGLAALVALVALLSCDLLADASSRGLTGERALLQKEKFIEGLSAAALDGMWDGDFVDPSANTVKHTCLSAACMKQFPKGMFSMNITGGGTMVDWQDIEIGGEPTTPEVCEEEGLHNVTRPMGMEIVKGRIESYEDMRLMVSVSPKDFFHNQVSREGLIRVDPFIWCIKFRVFVAKGKVKAQMHLFEDDFEGTQEEWINIKRNAENFQCMEEDLTAKTCEYDLSDKESVVVKRAEIVHLECLSGACLALAEST